MRNETGFKWQGTISKAKYITLAHTMSDHYKKDDKKLEVAQPSAPSSVEPGVYTPAMPTKGLNALMPYLNASLSPGISKTQGDFSAEIISNSYSISLIFYEVDDIEEVARIYESNGYSVTRYVQGSPFSVHNRMMYDYIQCDEVNVSGSIDGVAMDDIRERLKNGIRMWHGTGSGLVCESAPFNIRMGQLCVKDNTEV